MQPLGMWTALLLAGHLLDVQRDVEEVENIPHDACCVNEALHKGSPL